MTWPFLISASSRKWPSIRVTGAIVILSAAGCGMVGATGAPVPVEVPLEELAPDPLPPPQAVKAVNATRGAMTSLGLSVVAPLYR